MLLSLSRNVVRGSAAGLLRAARAQRPPAHFFRTSAALLAGQGTHIVRAARPASEPARARRANLCPARLA